MVRRHDNVAFMGGAHVFPGGRVDGADRLDKAEEICDGVPEARRRTDGLSAAEIVAYYVAAVRELFEEAGVLLARTTVGETIGFHDAGEAERFRHERHALADGRLTLEQLARRERLRLALDQLVLFAHWVTPQVETKRFDTRFFVASVPRGQDPIHDDRETTHSAWLDPGEALASCRRGDIALPPPTWTTLRLLEAFESVEAVVAWARERVVVRVEPGFVRDERVTMLTLPGDPLHPPLAGFETPAETRFILEDGRWRAAAPPRG